jgi:hypothetical protein
MTGTRLDLLSLSRANDGAYWAAADIAAIAAELDVEYRLVGGNAVSLLVAVHGVSHLVPGRETADADLGSTPQVIADERLLQALLARGYRQSTGNRFTRPHSLPEPTRDADDTWDLVIDVLAPSYQGRLVSDQPYGRLVVDEVPGLSLALARPPTTVAAQVKLTSGHRLDLDLALPDVISALCMKALAYQGRYSDRDAVDIWRLLEAAYAAGVTADAWPSRPGNAADAAAVLRRHFGTPAAGGVRKVSANRADQARVRALVGRIVGLG